MCGDCISLCSKQTKMSKHRYTRQGVRDLNNIKSAKPAGIRLPEAPSQNECDHRKTTKEDFEIGIGYCTSCGERWELYSHADANTHTYTGR
jgi:hypothetical protein